MFEPASSFSQRPRPAGLEEELALEQFRGLKRQIPLLYATIGVNLIGFHLVSGQQAWTAAFAAPVIGVIFYRLIYWHRLREDELSIAQLNDHLEKNLRFTRVLCVLFCAWSVSILIDGDRNQQQYVVLFASLAAVGCAVALACVPTAARQPLLLVALPIAAWFILSGEMAYATVGVSLTLLTMLIQRMLLVQDRRVRDLLTSKATLQGEREKVRSSEERYTYVSRATSDLIWDWDLTTGSLIWNDAVRTRLGYSAAEIGPTAKWWEAQIHPDDAERVLEHVRQVIDAGEEKFEDEYRFRRADGTYAYMFDRGYIIRDMKGAAVRMVGAMQDLTDRKLAEEKLLLAATQDALTGLPNRKFFRQRLSAVVNEALLDSRRASMLLLDLDDFKQVNDLLGHDAGDALLKELARRLSSSVPECADVARLGGDEFAVILSHVDSEREIEGCIAAILQKLREPFVHEGRILDCGATIGAAMIPKHGSTPEEVLKSADMALYAAKAHRRGSYAVFQPVHRAEVEQRHSMVRQAKAALQEARVEAFYQPQVNLSDKSVVGFEALLRWRHPTRGFQPPASIAAAFEDLELATAISDRMVEQVLIDIRNWLDCAVPFGRVAINAAAAEFRQGSFADRLLARLEKSGVPANLICLEVTENVFLGRGADHVGRALKTLSEAGVSIALDDFGTGYASLRHLKQFPVDVIKIDRSFVRDMEVDPGDKAIVAGVVNLAKSLGLKVVAEGVETRAQVDQLIELGCDIGQGFLFAKAVMAKRVPAIAARSGAELLAPLRPESNLQLVASRN